MPVSYDRKAFFHAVRESVFNLMFETQVMGCETILAEAERRALPTAQIAYVLATAFWETGRKMQPVKEVGEGRGRGYGRPDPATGQIYYGRGLVQLTWKKNYEKFAKLCAVDLVSNPDLALQLDIAVKITFEGMIDGLFTGCSLVRYIDATHVDYAGARRIINGQDKAATIAGFAKKFEVALHTAAVP